MSDRIIFASGSAVRAELLRKAGVPFDVAIARIDEPTIRDALKAEGATPRDIADTLAEMKATRVAHRNPGAIVIGCDQVLAMGQNVMGKAASAEEAREQLMSLRGRTHVLLSAAVVVQNDRPLWRHVGEVRLTMREFTEAWLDDYLGRNWASVADSVGAYKLEDEGVRLFTRIEGDYFTVLGLPLLELLSWLTLRGTISS
jgi:septum formation protein